MRGYVVIKKGIIDTEKYIYSIVYIYSIPSLDKSNL